MAKLNHNPDDIEDGIPEGVYTFNVTSANLTNFSTGNSGMTVVLSVFNDQFNFTAYENFTFTTRAKWKLKKFCEALGIPFEDEDLDTDLFEGKSGLADFKRVGQYLEVRRFLTEGEAEEHSEHPAVNADSIPF